MSFCLVNFNIRTTDIVNGLISDIQIYIFFALDYAYIKNREAFVYQ